MKLWEITNGFLGNSNVRCLVIAPTEAEALELARPAFEADGKANRYYGPAYWANLRAELLCDNVAVPWVGEVNDG